MSEKLAGETVAFGQRLAASQAFSVLFREGMALVEETAAYLDGAGRQDAKKLDRGTALTYATESMRLTTRLMQLASWLLLHRAVNEGEMTLTQANKEKKKVRLVSSEAADAKALEGLPTRLTDLITRSRILQDKVRRLDATIHAPVPEQPSAPNPLDRHMGLLKAAFERTEA
ncbi:MAG: protease adaptor protein RcdA [Xanthobacteraceae bacterium]